MPTSHFPRLVDTLRTPGHRRGVLVRRAIAVALLIAALASALSAAKELPRVPVFSRDLPAGAELALADVDLARLPASSIPDSTLTEKPEELSGRVITAAANKGEVITGARLLGEDLVSSLVGGTGAEAGRMIPVKLAEPDIIPHLHHGDTVDVGGRRNPYRTRYRLRRTRGVYLQPGRRGFLVDRFTRIAPRSR